MKGRRKRRKKSGCLWWRQVQVAERRKMRFVTSISDVTGVRVNRGVTRIFRGRPRGLFPFFWNRSSRSCSLNRVKRFISDVSL